MRFEADLDLTSLNTLRVPAKAALAVRLHTVGQARDLIGELQFAGRERLILGGGSNILFTRDWDGLVVLPQIREREVLAQSGDTVDVVGGAGEGWDAFVHWTLGLGLGGLENLALIPGTVGAAPVQNIGAYGVELRERLLWVETFDWVAGRFEQLDPASCGFGYRDSVFKHELAGRLITRVAFRLSRRPDLRLDYGEIRTELAARGIGQPAPRDVAAAVSAIRLRKLPDPARLGNAGSFFRNPLLPPEQAAALQAAHPQMPQFPGEGRVKVPAAWLIEQCGLKGLREGDAGVHEGHALVLVNYCAATGADVLRLARTVQREVHGRFGVLLEPEVRIV